MIKTQQCSNTYIFSDNFMTINNLALVVSRQLDHFDVVKCHECFN